MRRRSFVTPTLLAISSETPNEELNSSNNMAETKGMKHTLVFTLLLTLFGCSHAYVRQWDRDSVVACCPHGNAICTDEKLDDLASEKCGGRPVRIGGGIVESGATASRGLNHSISVDTTHDSCLSYRCEH